MGSYSQPTPPGMQDWSPLWDMFSPQRKTLAGLYFPPNTELASQGVPRIRVFSFSPVNPLEVQQNTWSFEKPFLVHTLTGVIFSTVDGTVNANGFRVQLLHQSGEIQRQLFNKHQIGANVLGIGTSPFFLKVPYMIDRGDQMLVEVKSLVPGSGAGSGVVTTIQVCLWGAEVEV